MLKTLIVAVLTAFTLALVGESVITLIGLAKGDVPPVSDVIELSVSWLVVLTAFYASVIRCIKFPRW